MKYRNRYLQKSRGTDGDEFIKIFHKRIQKKYMDILLYCSLLIPVLYYLCYRGVLLAEEILWNVVQNHGATAAYLMLTSILFSFAYCASENKGKTYGMIIGAGISYFVLFLNHNRLSLWLMPVVLIGILVSSRPTVERVKRVAQLFALYIFILCNMSLLTIQNTRLFWIDISYTLDFGVYLELVLALGALIFFHFWDRIPEDAEVIELSMLNLRHKMWISIALLVAFLVSLLAGGSYWSDLFDELVNEVKWTESSFYLSSLAIGTLAVVGIIAVIVILGIVLLVIRKKLWGYHPDKQLMKRLIALLAIFAIGFLCWELSWGNILLYAAIFIVGFSIEEER